MLFSEAPGFLLPLLGDLAETARRLDAAVEHLLLDEFQDTSDPQWAVLQPLRPRAPPRSPGSVFVVGDVKQAIYGWRGGRAEIFERIESELPEHRARGPRRQLPLLPGRSWTPSTGSSRRWRTAPALTDCAEARERWQTHFHAHRAHKDLPGYVEMCETPADADPLDYAAARIADCVGRLPPGTSVGVLARKNETVARLADVLRAQGVDVSSEGTGAVADDPAVEIILSALTLADHPGHTAAAFHVARSPLAAVLGLPPDLHTRPRRGRRAPPTRSAARFWCAATPASSPTGPPTSPRTARTGRPAAWNSCWTWPPSFDALPPMRPSEFVRAVRDAAVENPGAARVRVMTINRAKGLEFDAVFLPELDWKAQGRPSACLTQRAALVGARLRSPIAAVYSYPNEAVRRLDPALEAAYAAQQDEEITGMLCLLYVALTRARHALHLFVRPPAGAGPTPANLLRHALAERQAFCPTAGLACIADGERTLARPHAACGACRSAAPHPAPGPSLQALRGHAPPGGIIFRTGHGDGLAAAGLRSRGFPHPHPMPVHRRLPHPFRADRAQRLPQQGLGVVLGLGGDVGQQALGADDDQALLGAREGDVGAVQAQQKLGPRRDRRRVAGRRGDDDGLPLAALQALHGVHHVHGGDAAQGRPEQAALRPVRHDHADAARRRAARRRAGWSE